MTFCLRISFESGCSVLPARPRALWQFLGRGFAWSIPVMCSSSFRLWKSSSSNKGFRKCPIKWNTCHIRFVTLPPEPRAEDPMAEIKKHWWGPHPACGEQESAPLCLGPPLLKTTAPWGFPPAITDKMSQPQGSARKPAWGRSQDLECSLGWGGPARHKCTVWAQARAGLHHSRYKSDSLDGIIAKLTY